MATDVLPPLPARPHDAHKASFGTLVVIGGSMTMPGAPALCARAALRSGAGLVRLAVPAGILGTCLALMPSAIGMVLPPGGGAGLTASLPGAAVVAIGPGLGLEAGRIEVIRDLWNSDHPLVVDADGLTLLAEMGPALIRRAAPTVLTPHPGECRRLVRGLGLSGDPRIGSERMAVALAVAHRTGAVTVLKGPGTIIAEGSWSAINGTGDQVLAIPGSGDVLTGLIAALLAQGMPPRSAARLGVHLHGLAGDLWRQEHGLVGLLAQELADLLPRAMELHARSTPLPS